ncbi:D-glycerate dehydrogenase [Streptomyces sp. Je 1-332]|uniref:2-hydroxyacid dehydrogenase n=1 Tax=Streptomyces sp. Je 1-332 TaxID=3231270 RepID=UPI0034592964
MNIFITRALPGDVLSPLARIGKVTVSPHDRPLTQDELRAGVVGADAVITTLNDQIGTEVLAAGPQLRVVANTATGYDNLDVAAITAHGAVATNTPGVLVDATADLTMALLLDVTRRVSEGDRLIRSGTPWSWDMGFLLGAGLQKGRLGVVGMGAIGRAVARRAAAFGMDVVHHARRGPGVIGPSTRVELKELLSTADVVSLHCPLTQETHHLIDEAALRLMKRSAYLVNTARGPVVDEAALARALYLGEIAGAALDVYEDEPHVHPGLIELENVVLAPHLGSATAQTRTRMAEVAVENVVAVLGGGEPVTPVPQP